MKNVLPYVLCVFTLVGCLLNQTDPATTVPQKAFLLGAVVVEDMIISNQGELTKIQAEFAIKPTDKGTSNPAPVSSVLGTPQARQAAIVDLMENPTRAASCKKIAVDKRPKPAPVDPAEPPAKKPESLSRVSVGRLGFGPALQESLTLLTKSDKNQYISVLQPGIPAGAYVVVGEGSTDVDAFNEVLSMPEEIHHFRINGRDFGDNLIDFRPDQNMELFWKEPTITNDQNGILMDIIWQDADRVFAVSCALREDDIPSVSGFKNWTLDNGWFAEFPRTGRVEMYFLRAHLRTSQTKRSKVQLQGARTFYSPLDVKP